MSHQFVLLDTNGDGTGDTNAVGDYSGAPQDFFIKPPPGKIYTVHRLLVYIEDQGSFDAAKYGNNITLTNGIEVSHDQNTDRHVDLTGGLPVMNNAGWASRCYDAQVLTWGSGHEVLVARWSFVNSGDPIHLNGDTDARFVVRLHDDFTKLISHTFQVQGGSCNR